MNVLITGSNGFIGKNLVAELKHIQKEQTILKGIDSSLELMLYDLNTDSRLLETYCQKADFVFHLAGVNRPQKPTQFTTENVQFTIRLLDALKKTGRQIPVLFSSSVQAESENPYGISKRIGEELLFDYGTSQEVDVYVYRFPNIFGKWSRPNYNSVVATFCYNIARDIPIRVDDPIAPLQLVYIDDLVTELLSALAGNAHRDGIYCVVPQVYHRRVGEIASALYAFRDQRITGVIPQVGDPFIRKLYATYLSYLPLDKLNYPLVKHTDWRGSFVELFRTEESGQFSINIIRPHTTKGNHWHHTKNEKFVVLRGKGIIRFRKINHQEVVEYLVSDELLEVVDIPPGYTHNIENSGEEDMIVLMWCSEWYNADLPDTFYEEV